ncbi:hypothetical protein [Gluconobacter oxydans]|uniref:hypothetical protein n=1 Tax=Gluconobacter oxydans TaxID=442 RepID=UPI0039E7540F
MAKDGSQLLCPQSVSRFPLDIILLVPSRNLQDEVGAPVIEWVAVDVVDGFTAVGLCRQKSLDGDLVGRVGASRPRDCIGAIDADVETLSSSAAINLKALALLRKAHEVFIVLGIEREHPPRAVDSNKRNFPVLAIEAAGLCKTWLSRPFRNPRI